MEKILLASFRIALVFDGFGRGGVSRVMLALAREFVSRGHPVDLVVRDEAGPRRSEIPDGVTVINLKAMRSSFTPWSLLRKKRYRRLECISPLVRYFQAQQPDIVLSAGNYFDFVCVRARARAQFKPKLVMSQHNMYSLERKGKPLVFWTKQYAWSLQRGDAFVAVSERVADDLSAHTRVPREKLIKIYNPAISSEVLHKAKIRPPHSWFKSGKETVFISVGRLHVQKDFPTLIRAFAQLHARLPSRLIILGEGPERPALEALSKKLNLTDYIDLPGFVENPYAYMSCAKALVLSSAWEGFGLVIAEALACGCPVISTDCPSGPAEILANGRYGRLIPVGDVEAMAAAMENVVTSPGDQEAGRKRAAEFSSSVAAERYLAVFRGLLQQRTKPVAAKPFPEHAHVSPPEC